MNVPATWPNVITCGRLLLVGAFGFAAFYQHTLAAAVLFGLSWVLDGIDGWIARRLHQETTFGWWFDKAVDRLLIAGGVLLLVSLDEVPHAALLLLTKELASLPALTIHARREEQPASMGRGGKVAGTLQGIAVLWLLLQFPYPMIVVGIVAGVGGVVGTVHLYRVAHQAAHRP